MCFGSNTTTTNQASAPPASVTAGIDALLARGQSVAALPYQAPPTPDARVAPFSADQTAGFDTIRGLQGAYQPQLDQAGALNTQSTTPLAPGLGTFDDAAYQKYSSPYTQGVIDSVNKDFDRQGAIAGQNVRAQAASAGAFGGDRATIAETEGQRNLDDARFRTISGLRQANYTQAQGQFNTEQGRGLAARESDAANAARGSQQAGNLASMQQSLGLQGAGSLLTAGATQQQRQQSLADVGYQNFVDQRDYPKNQANFLSGIVHGYNPGATGTATVPGPSTASQLAGLGIAGAGAYAAYNRGPSISSGWGSAVGGIGGAGGSGLSDAAMSSLSSDAAFNVLNGAAGLARGGIARGYATDGYVDYPELDSTRISDAEPWWVGKPHTPHVPGVEGVYEPPAERDELQGGAPLEDRGTSSEGYPRGTSYPFFAQQPSMTLRPNDDQPEGLVGTRWPYPTETQPSGIAPSEPAGSPPGVAPMTAEERIARAQGPQAQPTPPAGTLGGLPIDRTGAPSAEDVADNFALWKLDHVRDPSVPQAQIDSEKADIIERMERRHNPPLPQTPPPRASDAPGGMPPMQGLEDSSPLPASDAPTPGIAGTASGSGAVQGAAEGIAVPQRKPAAPGAGLAAGTYPKPSQSARAVGIGGTLSPSVTRANPSVLDNGRGAAPVVNGNEIVQQPRAGQSGGLAATQQQAAAQAKEKSGIPEWAIPLMQAGFAIMGGTSPFALTNIGQGAMQGVNAYQKQRQIDATTQLKTAEIERQKAHDANTHAFHIAGLQERAREADQRSKDTNLSIEQRAEARQQRDQVLLMIAQGRNDTRELVAGMAAGNRESPQDRADKIQRGHDNDARAAEDQYIKHRVPKDINGAPQIDEATQQKIEQHVIRNAPQSRLAQTYRQDGVNRDLSKAGMKNPQAVQDLIAAPDRAQAKKEFDAQFGRGMADRVFESYGKAQ